MSEKKILKRIYGFLERFSIFSKLFKYIFKIRDVIKCKQRKSSQNCGINMFYDNILQLKNSEEIVYILLRGSAGDFCIYFLLLKKVFQYLDSKKIKIVLICTDRYKDIVKLMEKMCPYLSFAFFDLNKIDLINEDELRTTLHLSSNVMIVDLRRLYAVSENEFMRLSGDGLYETVYSLSKMIDKDFKAKEPMVNHNEYIFDNVDYDKINYLLDNYSNDNKLIICNMENKTFKGATRDLITFDTYLKTFINISASHKIKFVINSVYDEGEAYSDKNVLVTKLNFQEVIYLCEHDNISLFISERNGLNDVFKIFYPNIKQIIYYPDYYHFCVDKVLYYKIFHETIEKGDIMDFWHIPGDNVIEEIRANFFVSIVPHITKLLSQ